MRYRLNLATAASVFLVTLPVETLLTNNSSVAKSSVANSSVTNNPSVAN